MTSAVEAFNRRRRKRLTRGRIAESDVWCYACATWIPAGAYAKHATACLRLRQQIDAMKRAG